MSGAGNNPGFDDHQTGDVIKDGMKAADAIDKAFKRAEQIFSKYTVD